MHAEMDVLKRMKAVIRRTTAKRLEYNVGTFLTKEDDRLRKDAASWVQTRFPAARQGLCKQLGDILVLRREMFLQSLPYMRDFYTDSSLPQSQNLLASSR